MSALIDSSIEYVQIQLLRKLGRIDWEPIIAEVYRLGLHDSEINYIDIRIGAFGDAILRDAAGVEWIIHQTAFKGHDDADAVERTSGGS